LIFSAHPIENWGIFSNFGANLKNKVAMAIRITDECINCGACEPECPNNAIYEGAVDWKASEGTALKGMVVLKSGLTVDADAPQEPVSDDVYFIVTDKCTECIGFHEEPQCAAVCPVDCCIPDEDHVESDESLLEKKAFLHGE
jgi:ferredoxin